MPVNQAVKTVKIAGAVGIASQRSHEPWMWDVRIKLPPMAEAHMRVIPGCGYDGVRKVWVMPEEIISIMERKAL
jgi:hypothetical protein